MEINKTLLRVVGEIAEGMGKDADGVESVKEYAIQKNVERNEGKDLSLTTKGQTDPMSTINTGFGQEMTREVEYTDELYSMISEDKQNIFGMLPGYHGERNAPSIKVSVKGRINKFANGAEYTADVSHFYDSVKSNNAMRTGRVEIKIGKLDTQIAISTEELRYSTDAGLYNNIIKEITRGGSETLSALLINGDTQTNTATGNVNHIDAGVPVAQNPLAYYLNQDFGIRKTGIANGIFGGAVAQDRSVYNGMLDILGDYQTETSDLLWLLSSKTGNKARTVGDYSTIDKFGQSATVRTAGAPAFLEGLPAMQTREMPRLVDVDGLVGVGSTAAASNTQGTLALLYKPAVQYAYGAPMDLVMHRKAGAFLIDVAMWFGFTIVNGVSGLDKTVAVGVVNV